MVSADVVIEVFTLTSIDPTKTRAEMYETAGIVSHTNTTPLNVSI